MLYMISQRGYSVAFILYHREAILYSLYDITERLFFNLYMISQRVIDALE